MIPLIKVFPNLESEDSREEARRGENGTVNGIGKISRQCPREVYSIGNFGKINFVLRSVSKNLRIWERRITDIGRDQKKIFRGI